MSYTVGLAARVEKVSGKYGINSDIIWHHGLVIVPISQQDIRPKRNKQKYETDLHYSLK